MVRHVFTLISLIAYISTASALPAHPRHKTEVACVPPHVRALGTNSVSVCSPPSTKAAPSTQTLERRASKTKKTPAQKKASKQKATAKKKAASTKVPTNRKARAQARVGKGHPKATAEDKGRIPGPRLPGQKRVKLRDPALTMSTKKVAKVAERKDNRKLAKQQKFAAKVAEAKQKQKAPPYGIDQEKGALRKPQEGDMATKAWNDKQKAKTDKAARKAAHEALSPEKKAAKERASAAKQGAKRDADRNGGVKEKNRQKRIKTKAKANTQRKADNRKNVETAKTAYNTAQGLPSRGATYTSPKGNPYNGKDIRQAVYASEYAKARGGLGFNEVTGKAAKNSDKLPKEFQNKPNYDKSIPLPGVPSGGLLEFPILHNKQNGHNGRRPAPTEARIITQKNVLGQTLLVGKVGHRATGTDHHSF